MQTVVGGELFTRQFSTISDIKKYRAIGRDAKRVGKVVNWASAPPGGRQSLVNPLRTVLVKEIRENDLSISSTRGSST